MIASARQSLHARGTTQPDTRNKPLASAWQDHMSVVKAQPDVATHGREIAEAPEVHEQNTSHARILPVRRPARVIEITRQASQTAGQRAYFWEFQHGNNDNGSNNNDDNNNSNIGSQYLRFRRGTSTFSNASGDSALWDIISDSDLDVCSQSLPAALAWSCAAQTAPRIVPHASSAHRYAEGSLVSKGVRRILRSKSRRPSETSLISTRRAIAARDTAIAPIVIDRRRRSYRIMCLRRQSVWRLSDLYSSLAGTDEIWACSRRREYESRAPAAHTQQHWAWRTASRDDFRKASGITDDGAVYILHHASHVLHRAPSRRSAQEFDAVSHSASFPQSACSIGLVYSNVISLIGLLFDVGSWQIQIFVGKF